MSSIVTVIKEVGTYINNYVHEGRAHKCTRVYYECNVSLFLVQFLLFVIDC